jgi:hypothetical protein
VAEKLAAVTNNAAATMGDHAGRAIAGMLGQTVLRPLWPIPNRFVLPKLRSSFMHCLPLEPDQCSRNFSVTSAAALLEGAPRKPSHTMAKNSEGPGDAWAFGVG